MFQKRRGPIVAAIWLLSVSAQPMISYAAEQAPPAVTAEAAPSAPANTRQAESFSLEAFRRSSKAKLRDTEFWVKDKTQELDLKKPFKTMELKIDRLQDEVKPLGRSLKTSVRKNMPGKKLAQTSDRTFSAYGILLMMAFGLVMLLMSLSGPASRLGGRH